MARGTCFGSVSWDGEGIGGIQKEVDAHIVFLSFFHILHPNWFPLLYSQRPPLPPLFSPRSSLPIPFKNQASQGYQWNMA